MRHKHADVITAWANGKSVSFFDPLTKKWLNYLGGQPFFNVDLEWRIDPEEPNWWENIPEHGVLVKDKEDHKNIMLWLQNFCRTDDFIPLTNEEIEAFKR